MLEEEIFGKGVTEDSIWKDRNQSETPVRISDDNGAPGGSFVSKEVYRVVREGKGYRIFNAGLGLHSVYPKSDAIYNFSNAEKNDPEGKLIYKAKNGDKIEIKPDSVLAATKPVYITLPNGIQIEPIERLSSTDETNKTKQGFGGTFNMPEGIAYDQWLFRGHNIFYLNPKYLLSSEGEASVRKEIFVYPKDDEKNFRSSNDLRKFIPFGINALGENITKAHSENHVVSTDVEYQTSWKSSVGGSIGIEGIASFSASKEFRGGEHKGWTSSNGTAVEKQTTYSFALVIDPWQLRFSQDFISRLDELFDYFDHENLNSVIDRFIDSFGTHYAYAATFGAISVSETNFSKKGMIEQIESGRTFSLSAKGSMEGVSAGLEASSSFDTSFKNSLTKEDAVTESYTIGGIDKPNPIMVDLRPLSDLLNSVFIIGYSDENIAAMRKKISARIVHKGNSFPKFSNVSKLPVPIYSVNVTTINGLGKVFGSITSVSLTFGATGLAKPSPPERDVTQLPGDSPIWKVSPDFISAASKLKSTNLIAQRLNSIPVNFTYRTIVKTWYPTGRINMQLHVKGTSLIGEPLTVASSNVKVSFDWFRDDAQKTDIEMMKVKNAMGSHTVSMLVSWQNVGGKTSLNGWPHF